MTSLAHADAPRDWLFRASPGFGYAFDRAESCAVQGRHLIGGFAIGYEVADRLIVGGATTIVANTLLADPPCGVEDGLRLLMGFVLGPSVDWYPTDGPLQLFAVAGYTNIDHGEGEYAMGMSIGAGHGVGGTVGVGWDWALKDSPERELRMGLRMQVTAVRTFGGFVEHAALTPAIVVTVGVD